MATVKSVISKEHLIKISHNTLVLSYISPVVFTRTLLPLLQQTAKGLDSDVRIVNVRLTRAEFTP